MDEIQTIWHKGQRVLRTIVQVGIPSFLGFAVALPLIIDALGLDHSSKLYLWLVAFAAGVTAVAGALSRVMAIDSVNKFLVKIGLGSVPLSAAKLASDTEEVQDPEADVSEPVEAENATAK